MPDPVRRSTPAAVPVPLLLGALLLAGTAACGGGADAGSVVERADSAGIDVVLNRGPDRPLDWRLEPVFTVGGAEEGPEAFFRVSDATVAAGPGGELYVLDAGTQTIHVFDTDGAFLRDFGREGGGPGELKFPTLLAVDRDGASAIWDMGKGEFVTFAPDGAPGTPVRPGGAMVGAAGFGPEGILATYIVFPSSDAAHDSIRHRLVRLDDAGDTILMADLARPPGHRVDLGCVQIMGIDRLFEPSLQWSVAGDRVLLAQSARYEVELYDGAGRLTGLVRRDLEPMAATVELAAQEVGDSMRISFGGGGGCTVSAERAVEARGFAPVVPAVRDIIGAPDGSFWVARGIKDHRVIDVFDADGAYVGTLPEGTPFPAAFRGNDVVAVERDELEIPRVTVYRVARSDGNA